MAEKINLSLWPITTGANRAITQSEFIAVTCNFLRRSRVKSRVWGAIGRCFAYYWLKNWRETLSPITGRSNFISTVIQKSLYRLKLVCKVDLRLLFKKKKLDWVDLQEWVEFAMRRICYKWSQISKFLAKIARLVNYLMQVHCCESVDKSTR